MGHDRLCSFGIGGERSRFFWRGVFRQLIALGALEVDMGEFATMRLVADKARPILRGKQPVMLREDIRVEPNKRALRDRARAQQGVPEAHGGLFEALRAWRAAEAKAQNVPPYVIFHDATLREIAAARPVAMEELGQIRGVGASKLARYGVAVLEEVRRAENASIRRGAFR